MTTEISQRLLQRGNYRIRAYLSFIQHRSPEMQARCYCFEVDLTPELALKTLIEVGRHELAAIHIGGQVFMLDE